MARWTASAKWGEAPALDGQRDMPLALRLSGIRRDFPLRGDGIKCQDWVVEINLKPFEGEVP